MGTLVEIDPDLYEAPPDPESWANKEIVRDWLWRYHCSSSRIGGLLNVAEATDMEPEDWISLLGECWSSFDSIGPHQDELYDAVVSMVADPHVIIPALMDEDEHRAFDALPNAITVYRGCGPKNRNGFSWSLDEEIARNFPRGPRYWQPEPLLLTLTIPKSRAAALKLDRQEKEIIVFDCPWEPTLKWSEEALQF